VAQHGSGGRTGAWFEAIPLVRSQAPTAGILPWTSGEVSLFIVRRLLGVRFEGNQIILKPARRFAELGFRIKATRGTHAFLREHGYETELILKMHEGRPNIADAITNGEIQLVINTPAGKLSQYDDSYIRKSAIKFRIPYITTLAAAVAAAKGIAASREGGGELRSLQEYHARIEKQGDCARVFQERRDSAWCSGG
jgi:hypothetical protein